MLAAGLQFSVFALLGIVGPGLALLRLLGLPREAGLVLPAGLAAAAAFSWLALATETPALFPIGVGALLVAGLAGRRGRWESSGPTVRGAAPALLVTVALLAVTQYPWNRVGPSGEFLLDPFVAFDTAFHVGVTRELTLGYPPQVPGVAGLPLGYHLGLDLVRAAALRYAGVDPYDAIARFDVTLLAVALILALRAVTAALGGSSTAIALAGFIPLATDLSFFFARYAEAHWWADLLRGNVLISLALANPVIPGLALALGCLTAFAYSLADGTPQESRARWRALAALLGFAVPFFKVFLGAHLGLGLVAAALLGRSPRGALIVALPTLLGTALLALGRGGATVDVVLAPLDLVQVTRQTLGLDPARGATLAGWAVLWTLASLGLRAVGIPAAVRSLREGASASVALAVMALAAWPLGLLFRVSAPRMLSGQTPVNDAAYLVEQGGPLLAIFAALAIGRLPECTARARLAVVAVAALSLPSTVHFAWKKMWTAPDPIPAGTVRAMRVLAEVSAPGEVILQRPAARFPPAPVILAGRRVPYERFTPWLTQFAAPEVLEARHQTVYRFFRTTDPEEARQIAAELGARFLCLYGPDRVRFGLEALYVPVFAEEDARIYRLKDERPVSR